MRTMLDNLDAWLTAARRQKIYAANTAIATVLVTAGVTTDATVGQWLILAALVVQGVSGVLQIRNLTGYEFGAWFGRVGRATIYGAAVTFSGVGVALGWFSDVATAHALSLTSVALTAFGAVMGVVQMGHEEAVVSYYEIETNTDH